MDKGFHEKPDVLDFWTRIMEKLDTDGDFYQPVPEVLKDLCAYFQFGCSFIYQSDHAGLFFLRESYAFYHNDHLQEKFDIHQVLNDEQIAELGSRKSIIFDVNTGKSELEERLSEYFQAKTMILIPITDQKRSIIALVGVADRRGEIRQSEVDLAYSYSILRVIANYVKLERYQVSIQQAEQSLRSIMDNMGIDIYVNDFNTHEILYVNRSMAAPYGGVEKMLGKKCWETLYDNMPAQCDFCPQRKLLDESGAPTKVYSWDYQRPFDGSWFRVFSAAFHWVDGRLAHVVSSVDITENKRNERIIRQLAEVDALTGLPNRRKLIQDCEERLKRSQLDNETCCILFFDLDGFKAVNDTLGHRAGDELLCRIARFLESNPLTRGISYRHGGDEFVILCQATTRYLTETISLLLERFHQPWKLVDGEVTCRASIGISCAPADSGEVDALLHQADVAMYAAKKVGGIALFYNQGEPLSPGDYLASKS